MIVFVAAYLFREWVIQNTAPPATAAAAAQAHQPTTAGEQVQRQQPQQRPPITPADPENTREDQRDQIHTRLEELRRELHKRRNNNNNVNNSNNIDTQQEQEYHNPYSASVAGYHQMSSTDARRNSTEEDEANSEDDEYDIFNMNPPPRSGTQSPFASWRDYQQQDSSSTPGISQLRHGITSSSSRQNEQEEEEQPTTGTWRASEFGEGNRFERTDYFSEQVLDETMLEEEEDMEQENAAGIVQPPPQLRPQPQHQDQQQPPAAEAMIAPNANAAEETFDFSENMDGILEAIGMRGNLVMLVQNSILMCLMINLCLCVTVWIPYVIGRSVILVSLACSEEICLK